MSLNYIDKNGVSHIISGLTPGGNLETGAVATREGTASIPALATQGVADISVTFPDPMPDDDYLIDIEFSNPYFSIGTISKTANGFSVKVKNITNAATTTNSLNYKAFKLYEVADAEQLYSKVQDLEAMVPANASSTNKFTTADDLRTETRTLDRRLDDVEDVVPSSASITNKLVTQNDLSGVEIDKVEDINDVELTNIQDGQTLIWDDTNSKWVNGQGGKTYTAGDGIEISNTDVVSTDPDVLPFTFVGTTAEWNALSATDKAKYQLVSLTDDAEMDNRSYSTNELPTGQVWIDGKAIYKKTVKISSPSNGAVFDTNSTIDLIVSWESFFRNSGGTQMPMPYVSPSGKIGTFTFSNSTKKITFMTNDTWTNHDVYLTYYFTKTT